MFGFLKASKKDSAATKSSGENFDPNISSALSKTRRGFFDRVKQVFSIKKNLDEESLAEMEEILVGADIGIKTASDLIEEARQELKRGKEVNEEAFKSIIKAKMLDILGVGAFPNLQRKSDGPTVILIIGVNGAGKTTTIGKIANLLKKEGLKVMLCAADTFRAAAVEQLESWGERISVPVIKGALEAKPATVVFEAMNMALNEGIDCLLIDTAGRLHNRSNLMAELEGIKNSIKRHVSGAPHEVWLVIDGATGQNALTQAKEFNQICPLTGVIVTKLDGTSKGGIVLAIRRELDVPLLFIGVGEGIDDLKPFSAQKFVEALFEENDSLTLNDTQEISANAKVRRQRRGN